MKESSDIIKAYKEAVKEGKKCALATVVKVEGSSYRQPGARMLVTEEGQLTGAISGGCLEGDALKKALLAIHQKENKLITYNTSNEDDAEIGLQLGCNGIVHILFEYIDDETAYNPIELLKQLEKERKPAVMVSVFSLKKYAVQLGTVLFYRDNQVLHPDKIALELVSDVAIVLKEKSTVIKTIDAENGSEALIEYINPPVSLIIAGAGNDVQPLVTMTSILGWEVSVIDGRSTHAVAKRFPEAKNVLVSKPETFLANTVIDSQTYFVLMTHNYQYDLQVLKQLLEKDCPYIGVLGPKTKLERMLQDLQQNGIVVTEEQLSRIYGPIGLDLGAETGEEIALSIVAEIKAVLSGTKGTSLKHKQGKIHSTTIHV
ncbi:XdhC family protein [Flavobacterium hungaricum]|uniref:XdhC/CoxI family protein n=1 Tax=Flavobacterium hungaricum TaxID=2082725 RepID=A0ABR9TLI4_9FLAO|nr:XdhC/CoxI family protein [Flavobacterium hungaricum]MBE8726175.1 XdhC/CoxI family protein [Flavobacterium hungaricum]